MRGHAPRHATRDFHHPVAEQLSGTGRRAVVKTMRLEQREISFDCDSFTTSVEQSEHIVATRQWTSIHLRATSDNSSQPSLSTKCQAEKTNRY
jgi:hypothetical protein